MVFSSSFTKKAILVLLAWVAIYFAVSGVFYHTRPPEYTQKADAVPKVDTVWVYPAMEFSVDSSLGKIELVGFDTGYFAEREGYWRCP